METFVISGKRDLSTGTNPPEINGLLTYLKNRGGMALREHRHEDSENLSRQSRQTRRP